MRIKEDKRMHKYVELSIDGVIHESEIFGAAMPRDTPQDEPEKSEDEEEQTRE